MLYLLNSTIMPNDGVFSNKKATIEDVNEVLRKYSLQAYSDAILGDYSALSYVSALGHQGSADAFNALFPRLRCNINRTRITMKTGDQAVAIKVLGRLQEGQVLTVEQLNEIGFEFYIISMIGESAYENKNGMETFQLWQIQ